MSENGIKINLNAIKSKYNSENEKDNNLNETPNISEKDNNLNETPNISEKKIIFNKETAFKTYESEFLKNKESILKKIENFSKAPKTRKWLIIILLLLPIITILVLFTFYPKNHSIEIYKKNINKIINGYKIIENKIDDKIENKEVLTQEINKIQEKIIKEQNIKTKGFNLDYELIEDNGITTIKYIGKTYNSKEQFESDFEKIIIDLKNKQLKEYLRQKQQQ